jgi:hypothetical protein
MVDRRHHQADANKIVGRHTVMYRETHLVHYGRIMLLALKPDGSGSQGRYPAFRSGDEP